jgi:hypothetical protein
MLSTAALPARPSQLQTSVTRHYQPRTLTRAFATRRRCRGGLLVEPAAVQLDASRQLHARAVDGGLRHASQYPRCPQRVTCFTVHAIVRVCVRVLQGSVLEGESAHDCVRRRSTLQQTAQLRRVASPLTRLKFQTRSCCCSSSASPPQRQAAARTHAPRTIQDSCDALRRPMGGCRADWHVTYGTLARGLTSAVKKTPAVKRPLCAASRMHGRVAAASWHWHCRLRGERRRA